MAEQAVAQPQSGGWTEEKRAQQAETLKKVYVEKPELREQLRTKMNDLYREDNPEGQRIRRVLRVKGLHRHDKLDPERLTAEEVATAIELGLLEAPKPVPAATKPAVAQPKQGTTRPGSGTRKGTKGTTKRVPANA